MKAVTSLHGVGFRVLNLEVSGFRGAGLRVQYYGGLGRIEQNGVTATQQLQVSRVLRQLKVFRHMPRNLGGY